MQGQRVRAHQPYQPPSKEPRVNRVCATLALIAASAAIQAGEPTISIKPAAYVQIRAEWQHSTAGGNTNTNAGNSGVAYDATSGTNGKSDPVDFYLRRARVGFNGTYGDDWSFKFWIRADESDKSAPDTASRTPVLHTVFAQRNFKDDAVTHSIKFGLDYAFFNTDATSSSTALLLNQRASDALLNQRGTGVSYRLKHQCVNWGVDIQNNKSDDSTAANRGPNFSEREGLFYSTRIELTPPGEWNMKKFQEGWAGAEGRAVGMSLELGYNDRDLTTPAANMNTTAVSTVAYGTELFFHMDSISAMFEVRGANARTTNKSIAGDVQKSGKTQVVWLAQAGYAMRSDFLAEGTFLEPVVRYTHIDLQNSVDSGNNDLEVPSFGNKDYGNSGNQFELGANWYISGSNQKNKLGICWLHWKAEAGNGKADIVRLQHQINF